MTTRNQGSSGRARMAAALFACTAVVLPLAACSSGHPAVSASTRKTCAQVRAVLADGPDPGQRQAGHAEAQILPLRQVHAATPALRSAISELADAYDKFFATGGKSPAATSAVAEAAGQLNKLCKGAGAAA